MFNVCIYADVNNIQVYKHEYFIIFPKFSINHKKSS